MHDATSPGRSSAAARSFFVTEGTGKETLGQTLSVTKIRASQAVICTLMIELVESSIADAAGDAVSIMRIGEWERMCECYGEFLFPLSSLAEPTFLSISLHPRGG